MAVVAQIGIHEARARLSEFVRRAEAGEEIVIARYGKPVARLAPFVSASSFARVHGACADASTWRTTSTNFPTTSPTHSARDETTWTR